jgi:hypothetical protein
MPKRPPKPKLIATPRLSKTYSWTFFGRVLPERVPVSLKLPPVLFEQVDFGTKLQVQLNVHDGQIVAFVDVQKGALDNDTLRNFIESHIRSVLDLIGYLRGLSFDVEIISCANGNGNWTTFGIQIPVLQQGVRLEPVMALTAEQINAAMFERGLSNALSDYREAMRMPVQTGFFCYRAIEAMMQTMRLPIDPKKDDKVWERLRANLQVDKDLIMKIKAHADWARHGAVGYITDEQRAFVFKHTDRIINRYLEFHLGGRQPLDPIQFPPLTA